MIPSARPSAGLLLLAATFLATPFLADPAFAQGPATGRDYAPSEVPGAARPDTRALACADAAALVARAGAVVMTTGPMTYERIVRDGGFCTIELTTRPAFEPTRDVRTCFVGYRCVEPLREGRDGP